MCVKVTWKYVGSMIRAKKEKGWEISQIFTTYTIHAQKAPIVWYTGKLCCRVNHTIENSHKLLDKTYNKNFFKYFKYD